MTTVVATDEVTMKVIIVINFSIFKKISALQRNFSRVSRGIQAINR